MRKTGKPKPSFLWIVDDGGELDRWVAPHPLGKTLITTRSREYDGFGSVIDLEVLGDDEAMALLALCRAPVSDQERVAARAVAEDLGFLPLALDVAGAAPRTKRRVDVYLPELPREARGTRGEMPWSSPRSSSASFPPGHTASVRRNAPGQY